MEQPKEDPYQDWPKYHKTLHMQDKTGVTETRTEHVESLVKMAAEFETWIDKNEGSPVIEHAREKLREIRKEIETFRFNNSMAKRASELEKWIGDNPDSPEIEESRSELQKLKDKMDISGFAKPEDY